MSQTRQASQHVASLEEYAAENAALATRAHRLVDALDARSFNSAPRPGAWSVGQCLQHMTETHALYATPLNQAIDEARGSGKVDQGSIGKRFGWFERWFISSLEPPPRQRFKAPKKVQPGAEVDKDSVCQGYFDRLTGCLELRRRAEGLDLYRLRIKSPLAGWIRFRLGAAFSILTVHDQRHLWQAEQVLLNLPPRERE